MADRDLEGLFERFRREGDAGALGAVFDATAADLLRIARRITRDRAEAEDLLQSTFLAAIEGAKSFERGRSLRPWLIGILVRQAGLARRRRSRGTEILAEPASTAEAPGELAADRELVEAVTIALSKLPASDREVLVPLLLDGRRAVDIARELERRPDTVHMRIHRGLARLRRLLPAGFALGLSSIRVEVVRAARTSAAPRAGLVSSTAAIGGVLLVKKIVFAAAALALVSTIGWLAWPVGDAAAPELASSSPPPTDLELSALSVGQAPDSVDRSAGSAAEPRSPIEAMEDPVAVIEVVEVDGNPASGIAAAIVDAESSVRALTADADGHIRLEPTGERVELVVGGPDRFPRREILLLDAGIHRIELTAGRSVSGHVRVRGSPPRERLVLRLSSLPSPLADLETEAEVARALGCAEYDSFSLALETSADGAFRASGLPEDWQGILRVPRTYTFPDASPQNFGDQTRELESPVDGLAIEIEEMSRCRGRVVEAQGGLPVPGARLSCTVVWQGNYSTDTGTTTDDSGRFELPLGDRTFRSLRFVKVTDAEGRGNTSEEFRREDLGPELDVGDLRLERPPSRDVPFVVRDPEGQPIAKAIATLGDLASTPTGRDGRSALESLPLGAKELRVAAHGFWTRVVALPGRLADPLQIVLERGNELAIEIEGVPGDVDGRIAVHLIAKEALFANSDSWLPGWIVREVTLGACWSAHPKRGEVNCSCDESGRLVVEDLRPGLPITLRAIAGFEDPFLETTIPPLGRAERRRVALRFPETKCVISGRTLADDGAPLPRVRLALIRGDGKSDSRLSDRDGRFVFSLREAGEFQIVAERKGWAAEEQPVTVREGAPAQVEIRLQPSRHVVVDVVNPRGERVPGVRLEVRPPAGFVVPSPREDRAGRFHFDDLPPVPSVLRLSLAGETQERPIDPFVPELRIEVPAYGRVEFTWDPAVLPAAAPEANLYSLIVLRPIGSSREPLTFGNLAEPRGEFPVVLPGDYTLGLETYSNPTADAPERWRVLRPPVPVHVVADRTETVPLSP